MCRESRVRQAPIRDRNVAPHAGGLFDFSCRRGSDIRIEMSDKLQMAVLVCAFAAGLAAWWLALRGTLRLRRGEALGASCDHKGDGFPEDLSGAPAFPGAGVRIEGCVGVYKGADRDAYMDELAGILENPAPILGLPPGAEGFGPAINIRERRPNGMSFANNRPARLGLPFAFEYGGVEILPPADAGTQSFRVRYELDVSAAVGRWTARLLLFVVLVELPAVILVPLALGWFCVGDPNPAIRYQVFQAAQIAHVLWPPFLFLYLMKRTLQGTGAVFEAFLRAAAVNAAGAGG